MSPTFARRLRLLLLVLSLAALAVLATAVWAWRKVEASLPPLDGELALPGLAAPASLARDAQGVATVRAENRVDVARVLGFAHGQDRFFQMDLTRRSASGELAELVGEAAVPRDRNARLHDFVRLAGEVLTRLPPEDRDLLEAYAAGVNAGLASLRERPFEYLLLRREPRPWTPVDSLLVNYAMALDLQDENGHRELCLATVRDVLGTQMLEFFAPVYTPGDAPLDGSSSPPPAVPGPRVFDLRIPEPPGPAPAPEGDPAFKPGSNSFGLAGGRTAGGGALLANDMHLGHAVPNIWYRATLAWPGHAVTGVTLPGAPFMVAGSNGHVAWGFTNSYADTGDLVPIDVVSDAPDLFYIVGRTPTEFEVRGSRIDVRGGDPVDLEARWTVWGPLVGTNARGRPLAHKWIMHDPEAVNLELRALETARSVDEGIAIAHRSGLPTQNILLADRSGHLAWTLAGRLPRRFAHNGRLPVVWTFGDRGWDGFLPPAEIPVIRAGADGHLWTANNRLVGGEALEKLGDGGYDHIARARQIRDALALVGTSPESRATPAELLALQLDDRALWLERWQRRLLDILGDDAVAGRPGRAGLRDVAARWEGRAAADSASYRLVRGWRERVAARALDPVFRLCREVYPSFDYRELPYEHALWTLVGERPPHFLPAAYGSWDELLLAAADDVVAEFAERRIPLAAATWGERNTARIRHPLGRGLPGFLARHLDMPATPLPGDNHMPRVQRPASGASQRFVVEPGREEQGIFHMPAGQSGHPLSPFYRAGHDAWVRGDPSPFLPGEPRHTLKLRP